MRRFIINTNEQSKMQASEMKFLISVKGCTRKDHLTNDSIRSDLKTCNINHKIIENAYVLSIVLKLKLVQLNSYILGIAFYLLATLYGSVWLSLIKYVIDMNSFYKPQTRLRPLKIVLYPKNGNF